CDFRIFRLVRRRRMPVYARGQEATMAMTASIFSINALSTELALDRRTVTAALKDVAPDGADARGYPGWRLRTALDRLGYQRGDKRSSGASYKERWLRARAERSELELKERRGEVIEVPALLREIEQRWINILLQVRQRFLAVPSKLAGQHSRLRTPQDVFAVATRLVHEALDLLAASSEAATGVPGIASSRGDGSERPGHRRQEESEEDVEEDLAGDGAGGASRAVDAELGSDEAAGTTALARGSPRRGAARAR